MSDLTYVPSTTWRMLSTGPASEAVPRGLDALWHRAIGFAGRIGGRQRDLLRQAEDIVAMERRFRHMSDQRLRDLVSQVRDRFCLGRDTMEDRRQAFAIVREVADRTFGLRPFSVQIAAGLAMASGCIAEMATGEGKTLASTMPPAARKQAYKAHITYCTSQEAAADFLRDRLTLGRCQALSLALLKKITGHSGVGIDHLIQRGLEYAIVDEADAVLIDEAVTPLIISGEGRNPDQVEAYEHAAQLAGELSSDRDYRSDNRFREIHLTPDGTRRLADLSAPSAGSGPAPGAGRSLSHRPW